MKKKRVIARLDVKGPNVVKGIQMEGLRVVGRPGELAKRYYEQGADEIVYIDIVASLYERNNLLHVIEEATELGVSVPLTVGGGIRELDDIKKILRAGADKVAINTAATRRPEFISEAARKFGAQCIVGSVQAKKKAVGQWEALVDCGREPTGKDAVTWAQQLVELGAGELLITSVDRDGTQKGLDCELVQNIASRVSVPVIACGGAGNAEDIAGCFSKTDCDAVSLASILHYSVSSIEEIKSDLSARQIAIRHLDRDSLTPLCQSDPVAVSVVDYGLCNLRSVKRAIETLGHPVEIISSPEDILRSQALVLPGVGAFADGMFGLKERNLIPAIKCFVQSGRPLLGICLGMQLLMTESEEFGYHAGLDLISGKVQEFDDPKRIIETGYHVPHVGWNELHQGKGLDWEDTILQDTSEGTNVYFVHSFKVLPEDPSHALAITRYGEQDFCSVLQKENVYGTQFHPERCGRAGLLMLRNFVRLALYHSETLSATMPRSRQAYANT